MRFIDFSFLYLLVSLTFRWTVKRERRNMYKILTKQLKCFFLIYMYNFLVLEVFSFQFLALVLLHLTEWICNVLAMCEVLGTFSSML